MALGFLGIAYQSKVLPYHDEQTPVDLCQKKMLPIYQFSDDAQDVSNESLDIITRLDKENKLSLDLLSNEKLLENYHELINKLVKPIHNLCMPYWAYTPEFDQDAREYFIQKKQVKRGPFNILIQKKNESLQELNELLPALERRLSPYYQSQNFTIFDIMLASSLWGMYIFPEFQFSKQMHSYLQKVKELCHFEYHEDFWK